MLTTRQFLFIRLVMSGLLVLMVVATAPELAMITYSNIPVYGRDSGIDATMDLFLADVFASRLPGLEID